MNNLQIASVCHEANRAVQVIQADPTIPVSPHWDELDEQTRESASSGVAGILAGNTPEQSHEEWCKFKVDHGWICGPVKDETKRTHPLLVPYNELPPAQQLKDHLFSAIVHAIAHPRAGHQVGVLLNRIRMEQSSPSISCLACRYFGARINTDGGLCHRNPPSSNGWPWTEPEDWCGEYQAASPSVINARRADRQAEVDRQNKADLEQEERRNAGFPHTIPSIKLRR